MKTTLITILTFLFIVTANTNAFADTSIPTTEKKADSIPIEKPNTDTQKTNTTECEKCVPQSSSTTVHLISFSPLVLFIFIFSFIFIKLKKEGYKISDALKENETIPLSVPNPLATNALADANIEPFVDQNVQPKSASRLIAFISGLVTLGIAASFCTFWLYTYLKCGFAPKLETLTNAVLALGLGVVPYAFNKISDAIKN